MTEKIIYNGNTYEARVGVLDDSKTEILKNGLVIDTYQRLTNATFCVERGRLVLRYSLGWASHSSGTILE